MQCSILASDLIARSGVDTCGGIEEVVPRDRIELPTRGFSIPCSTD